MTPVQLIALLALGAIGLGLIASVALIVNGFWQLRIEERDEKSLLARLEQISQKENK